MWRARNGFTLLFLIIALCSSAAAQPGVAPEHRPAQGDSDEQRIAERRARLLEAGLQEFGTRGVLQTGVKDICRRAALTDRYFYESFRDSGDLFGAVFDQVSRELVTELDRIARAASGDRSLAQELRGQAAGLGARSAAARPRSAVARRHPRVAVARRA